MMRPAHEGCLHLPWLAACSRSASAAVFWPSPRAWQRPPRASSKVGIIVGPVGRLTDYYRIPAERLAV